MKPTKAGQIVKLHFPYPDENPAQLYVVLEIYFDVQKPRAHTKALYTSLPFPPINTVLVEELEIVDVKTSDLIGHNVIINKMDQSKARGRVIKVDKPKTSLELTRGKKGVETNVWLTIIDNTEAEHRGTLYIEEI